MTLVVENLTLRAGDVDGLIVQLACIALGLRNLYRSVRRLELLSLGTIRIDGCRLLAQLEDTSVSTLRNLPHNLEDEILELVSKNDITAFTFATSLEMQGTILVLPLAGQVVLAVAAPAIQTGAVEQYVEAFLVDFQRAQVNLWIVQDDVLLTFGLSTDSCHQSGGS